MANAEDEMGSRIDYQIIAKLAGQKNVNAILFKQFIDREYEAKKAYLETVYEEEYKK